MINIWKWHSSKDIIAILSLQAIPGKAESVTDVDLQVNTDAQVGLFDQKRILNLSVF